MDTRQVHSLGLLLYHVPQSLLLFLKLISDYTGDCGGQVEAGSAVMPRVDQPWPKSSPPLCCLCQLERDI